VYATDLEITMTTPDTTPDRLDTPRAEVIAKLLSETIAHRVEAFPDMGMHGVAVYIERGNGTEFVYFDTTWMGDDYELPDGTLGVAPHICVFRNTPDNELIDDVSPDGKPTLHEDDLTIAKFIARAVQHIEAHPATPRFDD
jgi:hypothetical protein